MQYKPMKDEWNRDGLRAKLFGIRKKTISARYSPEFVKEYLSHDEDSDFILRKSHNTLTLTSSEKFAFLNSKEMNGICDRVHCGKRNGTYFAVYHFNFKKPSDEFFVANDVLNEIAEMNNAEIRQDYGGDLPKTTSSGRTISDNISSLDSKSIYYYGSAAKRRRNLTMLSKEPFRFPVGINGYDLGIRKVPVKSNAELFMLTYSLPLEVADVLEEPIIKGIASAN